MTADIQADFVVDGRYVKVNVKKGSDPREDGMRRDEERPVSGTMLQRKWQRFLRDASS